MNVDTGRPLAPQVLQVSAEARAQRRARRLLEQEEEEERQRQRLENLTEQPTPPPSVASTSSPIQVSTRDTPEGNVVEVILFQVYILNCCH